MLKIEAFILLPEYQTNTWLLWDDSSMEAILVDPSAPSTKLLDRINELGLHVKLIVNTHGHGDHIGGNRYFAEALDVQTAIHPDDAEMLTNNRMNFSEYMGIPLNLRSAQLMLNDKDEILLGDKKITVIHTPGHTRGSICLLVDKYLISGDTLFERSIGRTDFPGGSHDSIVASIRNKLFTLADDVLVFPGHGPNTSIGLERANNPFVR